MLLLRNVVKRLEDCVDVGKGVSWFGSYVRVIVHMGLCTRPQ